MKYAIVFSAGLMATVLAHGPVAPTKADPKAPVVPAKVPVPAVAPATAPVVTKPAPAKTAAHVHRRRQAPGSPKV
jgi:hypothetical protein